MNLDKSSLKSHELVRKFLISLTRLEFSSVLTDASYSDLFQYTWHGDFEIFEVVFARIDEDQVAMRTYLSESTDEIHWRVYSDRQIKTILHTLSSMGFSCPKLNNKTGQ